MVPFAHSPPRDRPFSFSKPVRLARLAAVTSKAARHTKSGKKTPGIIQTYILIRVAELKRMEFPQLQLFPRNWLQPGSSRHRDGCPFWDGSINHLGDPCLLTTHTFNFFFTELSNMSTANSSLQTYWSLPPISFCQGIHQRRKWITSCRKGAACIKKYRFPIQNSLHPWSLT